MLLIIVEVVVTAVVDELSETTELIEDDNIFTASVAKGFDDIVISELDEVPPTIPDVPLSEDTLPGRVVEDG